MSNSNVSQIDAQTTVQTALAEAVQRFNAVGIETPVLDAQVLLAHVLGVGRAWLMAHPEATLPTDQSAAFARLVAARETRCPVAHLLGQREFFGLDLNVDERVLTPRPETELLVERALAWCKAWHQSVMLSGAKHPGGLGREGSEGREGPLRSAQSDTDAVMLSAVKHPPATAEGPLRSAQSDRPGREILPRVVDVGTGSGAIVISVAVSLPALPTLVAVDISPDALAVAEANARRHGVADRIQFRLGDMLEPLTEPVDLVLANLPYIETGALVALQPEVHYEPRLALDGGPDGLDPFRRLFEQVPAHVAPGGALLLEVGAGQGAAVADLARVLSPAAVHIQPDLAGHDRLVEVQLRDTSD
jgi:release factor glutamine methyltransferase